MSKFVRVCNNNKPLLLHPYVNWTLRRQFSLCKRFSTLSKNQVPANEQINLDDIKKQFRNFPGGQVVLSKDEDRGIGFICLDHTEKKNGFSGSMMVDLNDAVAELENWSNGKAVILHAKGDTFCSGGYLDTVRQICNHKDGFKMASLMQDSAIRLSKLPLVSASIIHGQAIGGGAELMLATDFRLFTPSAICRFVEANMGVGTGWGGGTLLKGIVGHSRTLEILLSCKRITSEDALEMGLANDIVNEDNHLEDGIKWILDLVERHDLSLVRAVKGIVSSRSFEEEKKIFATTWGGQAQLSALSKNLKHK